MTRQRSSVYLRAAEGLHDAYTTPCPRYAGSRYSCVALTSAGGSHVQRAQYREHFRPPGDPDRCFFKGWWNGTASNARWRGARLNALLLAHAMHLTGDMP